MNAKKKTLPAHFAPEARFEVTPGAAAPFRAALENEFERLQSRLLKNLVHRTADPDIILLYRHAATEAAAVATATGYPLLVLPELLEEKARSARLYAERQAQIRERSSGMGGVAA